MKIGDLVRWQAEGLHEKDIGLILRTYENPEPIVWVIWQSDGFEQGFTVAIAKDRIEVVR